MVIIIILSTRSSILGACWGKCCGAGDSFQYFQAEIGALLIDDVFNNICVQDVKRNLKIVCDIVKEHDLHLHTKTMREIIVSKNLSDEHKISLLKACFYLSVGGKFNF